MQPTRLAIICLAVGSTLAIARCAAAAPSVSTAQAAYCWQYAQGEYHSAVDAGSALPDEAFEGAGEECIVQWMALGAQWDDPANLDRAAELGLRAARPMPLAEAIELANMVGALGVDRVADGWLPTAPAEDSEVGQ